MKTSSKLLIGAAVVIAALAVTYRAVNKAPDTSLDYSGQMLAVISDGGCSDCHSDKPNIPFYAKLPIAKKLIMKHIEDGYQSFDIVPFTEALSNGTAPSEVDLAKIEKCVLDGTMPMYQYYLVHWGSSLTDAKEQAMLEGIKAIRANFWPNELAAEEFKNECIRPVPDLVEFDPAKAELGKLLYNDTRLSADGTISCATCHSIETAGVDNKRYSEGIDGQKGGVNAPTSFNAVFNFVQSLVRRPER